MGPSAWKYHKDPKYRRRVKIWFACFALTAIGIFTYDYAHATLFCYNGDTGTGMEWNAGVFIYTNQNVSPPVVIKNPGPVLETDAFTFAYCWANGPELTYLVTNLPDLRYPEVTTSHSGGTTIRKSLQHPDGTVYWEGQEAIWLMNNL